MKILAPLGYILGATTYLVEREDGLVVARIIWPDGSPLGDVPEALDEPIGRLTEDGSLLADTSQRPGSPPPRLLRAVYNHIGPMGLGIVQYQGEAIDGRRVWSRVRDWPGDPSLLTGHAPPTVLP